MERKNQSHLQYKMKQLVVVVVLIVVIVSLFTHLAGKWNGIHVYHNTESRNRKLGPNSPLQNLTLYANGTQSYEALFILPPHQEEYQRLRCRISFHALQYRQNVQQFATKSLNRLWMMKDTLACHRCSKLFQEIKLDAWKKSAEKDNESKSTHAKLRVNIHKLVWETINYMIWIIADLFISGSDLLASLVTSQSLSKSCEPETYKPYSSLVPALYVFGDSLSDSGNNNFLQTEAKVNYKPYGIDFPSGVTGRFSNGKNFVDFIAQFLGIPFVPPYLSLSTNDKMNITTGVNYASGSAGILPETGNALGENLSFDKQIMYFQETVTKDLIKIFKSPAELLKYMSKSILVISIGNNDYINNYLQPVNYMSSQIYTPQEFADLLVDELLRGLKKLYILGARKFLVFNIGRIGCIPNIVNSANPKPTTPCVEDVNNLILFFNTRLPREINNLEHDLIGSTFVLGDSYNAIENSSNYGFNAAQTPCCEVGGSGMCLPNQIPCQDRALYTFWDAFHPTEVVYDSLARSCFDGSFTCVPINVQQLAEKQ